MHGPSLFISLEHRQSGLKLKAPALFEGNGTGSVWPKARAKGPKDQKTKKVTWNLLKRKIPPKEHSFSYAIF